MNKFKKIKINKSLLVGLISLGIIVLFLFLNNENIKNKIPLTLPLFNENGEVLGESLINPNREGGCFTEEEVPKNNEYISYTYDGTCYIYTLFSEKGLVFRDILDKSYKTLYESRLYFDGEIKKLHDTSKDMKFVELDKQEYIKVKKEVEGKEIEESILNIGKYKITITSPWDNYLDEEDIYTNVVITKNGSLVDNKKYKGSYFTSIDKIQINQTYYYILILYTGGMHGDITFIPIVFDTDKLTIGNSIEGISNQAMPEEEYFFKKNRELYVVIDDSRYFYSYSGSNNASYNSAVPRIYKFDKTTGNLVLDKNNFLEIYKESARMISDDLKKLNDSFPIEVKHIITQTDRGRSLIPYFDYYLGIAIIVNKSQAPEIRKNVEKLYKDFFGDKYEVEAHFDGYKDFEK